MSGYYVVRVRKSWCILYLVDINGDKWSYTETGGWKLWTGLIVCEVTFNPEDIPKHLPIMLEDDDAND